MTLSFYLTRPEAETETSIYVRICYAGNKLKFYTPEKILPKFWNKETQRAKQTDKFRQYPEFNTRLDNLETDIKNVFRKYVNDNSGVMPNPDTLKKLLDKEVKKIESKKEEAKNFFTFYEQFIKRSEDGIRMNAKNKKSIVYNTTKGYISTLHHLINFQSKYRRKIDFDTVDLDFYNEYIKHLTYAVKLSHNTIGDHIKRIKTVMNEATERGINKNLSFRSKYFTKLTEETGSIYLNEAELKELESLDLTKNSRLERVRDLFIIGCHTGLRYSDYSLIRPEHIKDGFIEITQVKTGEPVVVPIHPAVKRILTKYKGQLPESISNQKTNNYLKELGKMLPCLDTITPIAFTKGGIKIIENYKKWELLSTHTARRSFATNEYLAATPTITIMAVTGHKTEKAFLRYIKLTSKEHAKLLKLHWQKRHEMKAV